MKNFRIVNIQDIFENNEYVQSGEPFMVSVKMFNSRTIKFKTTLQNDILYGIFQNKKFKCTPRNEPFNLSKGLKVLSLKIIKYDCILALKHFKLIRKGIEKYISLLDFQYKQQ